jgi:hypothetical protein
MATQSKAQKLAKKVFRKAKDRHKKIVKLVEMYVHDQDRQDSWTCLDRSPLAKHWRKSRSPRDWFPWCNYKTWKELCHAINNGPPEKRELLRAAYHIYRALGVPIHLYLDSDWYAEKSRIVYFRTALATWIDGPERNTEPSAHPGPP